jgi:predicted dithiol-disulfide oxidoreductase (DUF899 family)
MDKHEVVSREAWVEARKALLVEEKAHSRARDALSRKQRALPWVKIEQDYAFDTPQGKKSLSELFGDASQLIVYHFMFGPDWDKACKSCSFLIDHLQYAIDHLAQRDAAFVAVSRAPLDKLTAFRERMGWRHDWVSSRGSSFNFDFGVSFEQAELDAGTAEYNYAKKGFPSTEAPGLSVFAKDEEGSVFHTYSTYARGLDIFMGTYNLLDLVPKGRDEDGPMSWVRLRDEYE